MRLVEISVVVLLFLLEFSTCEYYDDQPKFLTENGNFIIESAIDKNISFRLKGNAFLNVNDMNVMNLLQIEAFNRSNVPNSNLASRISSLEEQIRSSVAYASVFGRPSRYRGSTVFGLPRVLRRLDALEARMNNGTSGIANINVTVINRRIRRLEIQFNQLTQRLNADNCSSNPCKNGGQCLNTFGGYICKCTESWEGANCEDDVNECANFAGTDLGCQNMAICENFAGGYRCRCQNGWYGTHCTRRTIDCLQSTYELCGHGACLHSNDANGYRCICDQGWISNGSSPACNQDVNECESPNPHCSMDPEVVCINLPGTYTCGQCPHGYTGNGHYCKDVNECEVNNGGCSTQPYVACINTRGSSKCAVCPFGYAGDGRVCIRTRPGFPSDVTPNIVTRPPSYGRPCESNAACHPVARCVQNVFGVSCICPFGYTGDGFGPYGCERSNTTLNVCSGSSNPCLNGGTCTNVGLFGFRCECPPGTLSPRCTLSSSGCASNPCLNGGTCTNVGLLGFRCVCLPGRIGRNCQTEVRTCGGVLNAVNGTLKYPLSSIYPHNSRCAWLIKTDEDKVLNVTFKRFELERSRDCRFDWLQIHDGRSSASYMIGRFCGSDLPMNGNIVTTQNMLYLWFRSDNSSSHGGFELTWNTTNPVCGGEIHVTEHGTIKSPGSPGNYPPNRDCIWKLIAPPSKRIQLHFFTMQLEAHETCQYDYLAIYNGLSIETTPIEKFCNTMHPQPMTSSGNELTLHFHSDSDGTDAGFQIHYSVIEGFPGCGGTFTAISGEFGSPIQNGVYPKNIECHYIIKLPKGMRIHLTFLSFSMESSLSCKFDYVEIYEGPNENAPKAGRWCGVRIPPEHSSLTNEVTVVFHTDWSENAEGFRIKYETVCGGKFEDDNGVIMSPFYPNPYENSRNCVYDIEAPLGKAIVLNFTDFDIENDCDYDSLAIYDGPDSIVSKEIGNYCGEELPPPAISSLNHLHLVFDTDSSISGRGFKANYSFIDAGCGGIIKKLNSSIAPPKIGDRYVNDGYCKWIIVAPLGYLVQLTFTSFEMEYDDGCRYDYLSIFDNIVNHENGSRPIGRYCGTSTPPVIMSSSRALTLFFKSDESDGGEGFVATYSFIDGRNVCGGVFYAPTGFIRSPGYPEEYQPEKDCVFIVHAPNGKQVDLHVKSFQLEHNAECSFDFLEIRNGGNNKSPLIGTFCGTEILPNIRSFSNTLYLRFHTDSSNQLPGFEIEYDTSINGCGGTFRNAQHGSLTSPNYPEPYGANMQCDYKIHVSRGSTINLVVTDLDMETDIGCSMDYLSFYDGEDASARHIGTYCQTGQIIQVESTTNYVFVRMVSDISNQGRGFEIKFNAVCQREIRDLRGVIESPNFPENYPNFANCSWRIKPPLGNRLFIEFSHFEFERQWDQSCSFDFITIEEHDSNDMTIRSNKYCQEMPKPLNTSNTVIVKFESDYSNTAGGFHLEYEVQGCGGTLNKPNGRFTSPNYPNSYPHDTHCQWTIEVDYGNLIEISFTDFDFEASPGCYQDGLVISNDQNATKILSKFCGSIHNASNAGVVTSPMNKVFIHFFSDLSYSGRGFSATYRSVPTKCGGLFTLSEGNITSMHYPNNYESNSHCEWLIRTEPSHSISLLFNDFDLQSSANCSDDVVKVYDGSEKRDDKVLLRVCGNGNQNGIGFGKPLISETSELLVVMDSDDSFESKGFSATYEPRCGSRIKASTSGLLQIGHNLRWLAQDCQWVITAENPNQHVSLSILHLENEPIFQKYVARFSNQTLSQCLRKILIYDGTSTLAPKIMEICTNKHPPTIVSEGNSLTIALDVVADHDFAFTFDLKAAYSVIDNACGGEFSSVSGQIASPGYPKSYKNNIECEWTIKASPGNQMVLNIVMLDIDETATCNGDYLEIRETNSVGKILGVYCGSNIPSTLPTANTYWLKFRSDNDGIGNGFRAEYSYARIVEQNGSMGVITSPMYPTYIYYTLDSYKWRITVERGSVIRISIDNCILKRDSQIQIYDGYDSSADLLSTIETDNIPSDSIVSTTHIVLLEFQVNTFSESKFKLNWIKVPKSSINTTSNGTNTLNCTENSVVTVGRSDVLRIRSPGWPNGYESELFCSWTLLAGAMGYHVGLTFTAIDLEAVPNCIADFVQVGSSNSMQNFNKTDRMCNLNFVSRRARHHGTPNLQLTFQSDYGGNRSGFESIVILDCGGLLDMPSGNINHNMTTRPMNASVFWVSEICTWNIKVRLGRTIRFDFEQLNLEKNSDGTCNSYLLIRNGPNEESPFLGPGKFCGKEPIELPKTSSNQAMVQFARGRLSFSKREFILNYEQVEHDCGGHIMLKYNNNNTIITSPNYPNIPSPHIECIWRVTAPGGELLKIDFLERFDLSLSTGCVTEFLQIQEGSTSNAPVNNKLCGSTMPSSIFLSSNLLRLHYLTDALIPRNGFKLKVSFVRCGKSITSNNGFLISPGYPGKGAYPKQSTCDYHVSGIFGSVFNLTFTDLDLPSARNCSTVDHIEIISAMRNTPEIVIATVCGSTIPDPIWTYTSKFLVRFVTKSENGLYRGYRIGYQITNDVCGGSIEASTGIIQSPGYPTARDSMRACEWTVTVPKGRRVKVDIIDFDASTAITQIPLISGNANQKLIFYNDYFETRITSVTSANETNTPIYSTDNKMTIQSLIRSNIGHRGFKLRFTSDEPTICEGNMDESYGIIQSPENVTGFYCEFERNSHQPLIPSQPDRGTLSIKFAQQRVITNRTSCPNEVYTGVSIIYTGRERRPIQSKCPPKYENIASPFPSTKIIIKYSTLFKHVFDYKIHECGGIFLLNATTRLTLPNFDSAYGELDCAWQLTTNSDQALRVMVTSSALNCETDYINIYNGRSPIHPRVNRICGDSVNNQTMEIRSKNAFIEYHTDQYQRINNFNIEITTMDGVCGGMLNAPNFAFSSPKNGTKYPFNAHCEWILRAQNGFHVGLYFPQRFMLEASDSCQKDYVQVFDKVDDKWVSLARLCGRDLPHYVNSTGRYMKVVFHSDDTIDGDGFTAAWNENCGGIFTATNQIQTLSSPRHPDRYPKNLFCNYSIVAADKSQSVNLNFLKFDLEETSRSCNFDNLTIYYEQPYRFSEMQLKRIGVYCWHDSITTFRNLKRIDVVFRSDSFLEKSGFLIKYNTDTCGGNITQSSRISSSNEFGEKYLSSATCIWNITAPPDKRITIRFEQFNLEKIPGCYSDYVDVYDGYTLEDSKRKAKLCGNLTGHAPTISIDSNTAIVIFSSDNTIELDGFSALILFTKKCNQQIRLNEDQRNYTLNKLTDAYEALLHCEYFITASEGYIIQAKFNQFHLRPCEEPFNVSCGCDYLNIRDGAGPFAESLGTYCGQTNPSNVISMNNEMYMQFVTDSDGSSTGFSVEFQMIKSPCGVQDLKLNESRRSVEIVPPMDGDHYMADANCLWTITVDEEDIIDVRFDRFDLEGDPQNQCAADYLEIRDEGTKSYIREGLGENTVFAGIDKGNPLYFYHGRQWPTAPHRYCGNGIPMDYLSSARKIDIRFKSNEIVEKSGFKFTASILDACARNYTKLQGRLYAKKSVDCELHINVPDNYMITLYFTSLEYHFSTPCTDDNMPLKVYNDRNNELIQSYCGESAPKPLFTTTNRLRMKFKKIPLSLYGGDLYDITYLATDKGPGCGGELYNYGGMFTSPGYPDTDRNNTDCTWIINVPMNLFVALQFQVFDMGKRLCDVNYLEIIEFDDNIAPTKFCGTESPAPYRGRSNRLKVHFKSSSSFSGSGWVINFMGIHENSPLLNY